MSGTNESPILSWSTRVYYPTQFYFIFREKEGRRRSVLGSSRTVGPNKILVPLSGLLQLKSDLRSFFQLQSFLRIQLLSGCPIPPPPPPSVKCGPLLLFAVRSHKGGRASEGSTIVLQPSATGTVTPVVAAPVSFPSRRP